MKNTILLLLIPFLSIAQKKQKTKIVRDSSGVTIITVNQTGGQTGAVIYNVYQGDGFIKDAPMNPHIPDSAKIQRR